MYPIVTHITKTLALLAVLLLPAQRSMASTCCCHRGNGQSLSEFSTDSQTSCCDQHSSSPCSCQTSDSGSDSQPCRCPSGCRCTASSDVIALSANLSSEWDVFADLAPHASASAFQNELCGLLTRTDAFCSAAASGSTLCVQLCRYQL